MAAEVSRRAGNETYWPSVAEFGDMRRAIVVAIAAGVGALVVGLTNTVLLVCLLLQRAEAPSLSPVVQDPSLIVRAILGLVL